MLIHLYRVLVHSKVSHHGTSVKVQYVKVQYDKYLQYTRYHCIAPVYGFYVPAC